MQPLGGSGSVTTVVATGLTEPLLNLALAVLLLSDFALDDTRRVASKGMAVRWAVPAASVASMPLPLAGRVVKLASSPQATAKLQPIAVVSGLAVAVGSADTLLLALAAALDAVLMHPPVRCRKCASMVALVANPQPSDANHGPYSVAQCARLGPAEIPGQQR